jgi:hypothetical protein
MGGQPSDNPRDMEGGGTGRETDDRGGGTGPIPGAFGEGPDVAMAGGSARNETVDPMGDRGITGDFGVAEAEKKWNQAHGRDAGAGGPKSC